MSGSAPGDRWLIWPATTSLVTVVVLLLLCRLPGPLSLLAPLLALLIIGAAVLVLAAVVVRLAIHRRPRSATSIVVALLGPVLLWGPIGWSADCLHLGLTAGLGWGQNGREELENGRGSAYDWSVGFAGGPNTFLVFDRTDGVVHTASRQVALKPTQTILEACSGKARRLIGHYFECEF